MVPVCNGLGILLCLKRLMMITKHCNTLVVMLLLVGIPYNADAQKLDKANFYAAMASGKLHDINNELNRVGNELPAYRGALLIRKAGLVKIPAIKLKLFKDGVVKLEKAIKNDPDNIEYRFLRLTIQEHAPKIVKYRSSLQIDKDLIIKNFYKLSPVVQQAIKNYSAGSTVLSLSDF